MEGSAKYRSSPLCRSAYIAARVARCGRARCPTMCTAVPVHKSEKHSFPVTGSFLVVAVFTEVVVITQRRAYIAERVRRRGIPIVELL